MPALTCELLYKNVILFLSYVVPFYCYFIQLVIKFYSWLMFSLPLLFLYPLQSALCTCPYVMGSSPARLGEGGLVWGTTEIGSVFFPPNEIGSFIFQLYSLKCKVTFTIKTKVSFSKPIYNYAIGLGLFDIPLQT